jgi:hypothetical protein
MSDTTELPAAENAAASGATTATPAEPTTPETGKEQEAENAQSSETEGEQPQPKRTPWFQTRIDELVREKWDQKRRADAAEQELALFRQTQASNGQQPPAEGQTRAPTQAEIDRLATERAKQIAAEQRFNEACNSVYEQGKGSHADFDEAVRGIGMLTGGAPPREFLDAVTALPDGSEVYYQLGKNLDEAARIMSLSPVRMAVELAKLSGKPARAKSNAPAPISPVGGTTRGEPDPDKMSMNEWVRWREEQLRRNRR